MVIQHDVRIENARVYTDPHKRESRVVCSCEWTSQWHPTRRIAESVAIGHIEHAQIMAADAPDSVPEAQSGPETTTATQHTGDGDGGYV